MDNVGCHPEYLKTKFSHITICFLPANTSQLQPLDLGIIQDMFSKIDECERASEVANAVNILIAVRWIAQAWKEVKARSIGLFSLHRTHRTPSFWSESPSQIRAGIWRR